MKPPHPFEPPVGLAATVNVAAVEPAVPAGVEGFKVIQVAGALPPEVTAVNGIPSPAEELTYTVCAGPGVQALPLYAQLIVTLEATRPDAEPTVTTSLTARLASAVTEPVSS